MINSKQRGGLSELARSAKQRLLNNKYLKPHCNVVTISTEMSLKEYAQSKKPIQKQSYKLNKEQNTYEENLYKKVCEIIENGRDNFNPVSELIDRKFFLSLEPTQKQHYLNTLGDKYKQLKQRYYKEHCSNKSVSCLV